MKQSIPIKNVYDIEDMQHTFNKKACHDLAVRGQLGSVAYFAIWLLIIFVTPLKQEWPVLSLSVLAILGLLGVMRGYAGYHFDTLFEKNPSVWLATYSFFTIGSSLIWGLMTAMALWFHTLEWTGFLVGFTMAGLVSGGTISLSTHQRLQVIYILSMLLPVTITCLFIDNPAALSLGALFAFNIVYLWTVGRRLNKEYWAALQANELLMTHAIELDEAREKAESLDKAKSLFLSHINHELRTPLNSIIGFGRLLNRSEHLGDKDKEHVSIINKSSNYLLKLINHVLELSKIESGKTTIDENEFNLRGMIEELREMFSIRAQKRNLLLDIVLPDDLPDNILTDELKLRQVLINLLNNAIKFTEKGKVILSITCETISKESLILRFSIKDTGIGIPAEDTEEIFKSFNQSNNRRHTSEGTGLGLTICKEFVEMMGGDIHVHSTLGEGSEFIFSIQCRIADKTQTQPSLERRHISGVTDEFSLLIVDDKSDNRKLLVDLLQPIGFNVIEASNGKEAIELFEAFSPDLIWMDLLMPVMNGYEALNVIRKSANASDTPVIACTSESFYEDHQKALVAGFNDFIRKPLLDHDVFDIIERHLNVHYVYSNTPDRSTPITSMTEDETMDAYVFDTLLVEPYRALREAVEMGDMELITQAINIVETISPAAAKQLAQHRNNFAFDEILHFIAESKD